MTTKQKQCLLFYLGYYVGNIDGSWGTLSKTATKAFQKDFGLKADGVCGTETEKALKHAVCYGMPAKKTESSDDWWDEIEYFGKSEFACKCGGRYCNGAPAEMQKTIVKVADRARKHFGKPAHVTSGLRCPQHNTNEGGVSNSRHLSGKAIDLYLNGVTSAELLSWTKKQSEVRYAYAVNNRVVHMDME